MHDFNHEKPAPLLVPSHPRGYEPSHLLDSPSYEIAFQDKQFIDSDAARAIRIDAEVTKPEWFFERYGIRSTIIVFGSARFVDRETALERVQKAANEQALRKANQELEMSRYYELARQFAFLVSQQNQCRLDAGGNDVYNYVICTGGGPGIMEAGNRGAYEAGALSIGLNIQLPYEQHPNPYITPQLCFQFHYFAARKLHFLLRAQALVVFPGGFGTFDELFEALTLRQTNKMQKLPVIVFGREFWEKTINFNHLVETGVINPEDLELFHYVDSPEEAWEMIQAFHRSNDQLKP
ncbi:MAG: TIGR00730 family Rossman fold protein [Planctomycetaceae bacterium]|nr:TIGR00730 family Rossman fold protein [Planctomycetaceae bacterium]